MRRFYQSQNVKKRKKCKKNNVMLEKGKDK